MRLSVLELLHRQRREERADEDEGEGGGGGEDGEDVNHGEDGVDVEDEDGVQPEQKKRRGPKAFTAANAPPGHAKQLFLPDPNKKDRMICLLCRERYPNDAQRWSIGVPQGKGPGNAEKHAWNEHRITFGSKKDLTQRRFITDSPRPTDAALDDAFLNELIDDLQPFSFVKRPGRMAVSSLTLPSGYMPPSNMTLKARLHAAYKCSRGLLREAFLLPSRKLVDYYCVSFDGWKASLKAKVMYAAKVHFVTEDGVTLSFPLEIAPIPDKQAETVARWLQHALQNAGLEPSRLFALTGDGAERKVGAEVNEDRAEMIPPDEDVDWEKVAGLLKVHYVWCGDHRLSLVVKKTLRVTNLMQVVVEPTEELVRFIRKTPKVRAQYEKYREEAKVAQVVKTFPATRYAMAVQLGRRFLSNYEVVHRLKSFCSDSRQAPFNAFPDTNLDKLKRVWSDVLLILEPLDAIISLWSTSTMAVQSGRFYLEIFFLEARARVPGPFASPQGNQLREAALAAIETYFADRTTNRALVLAAAFTPQVLKDENWPIPDGVRMRSNLLNIARSFVETLFPVFFPDRWNAIVAQTTKKTERAFTFTDSTIQVQWSCYVTLPSLQEAINRETDPLDFWFEHRKMFPDLFLFARMVHSVPMSSSDIERLWSKLKRVLTKLRGALEVETGAEQVWCNEFRATERRLDAMWTAGKLRHLGPRPVKDHIHAKFDLAAYFKGYE